MRFRYFFVILLNLALLTAISTAPSRAEWQPTKPVELWVTFGKGAHADIWAREVAEIVAKYKLCPMPIEVVNIPKGVGVEAFPKFQARAGDDHTLMLILPNAYTVPLFNPEIGFDIMTTTPIASMGEETLGLWINASHSDVKTMDDFVRAARSKGPEFKIVGPPAGTPRALLSEMIIALYGLEANYVGIKKIGSTARVLAEKGYDAGIFNPAEQLALTDPSSNRLIATFSYDRFNDKKSVPSVRETGMDIVYMPSRIVIGPPAMSHESRDYYASLIQKVFETSDWQKIRVSKSHIGNFLQGPSVSEYMRKLVEKHERWKMAVEAILHDQRKNGAN